MNPLTCPTESKEQIAVMNWANAAQGAYPDLKLLHHIPNGGGRSKPNGAKLKAEGVKPGVPDLYLPVARGGFHGLYIEMKRRFGGVLKPAQKQWLADLKLQGYCVRVCRGSEEATNTLQAYLCGNIKRPSAKQVRAAAAAIRGAENLCGAERASAKG